MKRYTYLEGLKDGIPIALGYLGVSFAFGMKAVSDGLFIWQAVMISMLNLTSAGQFAGLPLMTGGANMIEMVLTQLVINMRYALMSLSLGQKLESQMNTVDRMLVAFFNTDEVFAVASSKENAVGRTYLYGLGTMPYIGWALGTLLGAVAGAFLPMAIRQALGIAIYAMFLAIIIPPAKIRKPVRTVVIVAALCRMAMAFVPYLKNISGGFAIIVCAVVAAGLGAYLNPIEEAQQ